MSTVKTNHTLMYSEAAYSGSAVCQQITENRDKFALIGEHLRQNPPRFAVTIGRGSSDHAAVYGRYLIETQMGIITSPSALSVSSVYNTAMKMDDALCIAISQSGQSPDLVATMKSLRAGGAYALAFVNAPGSPLADTVDHALPLCAGPEKSVAATKSFITSMAAMLQLVAHWKQDAELLAQVELLPDLLEAAWALDWSEALPTLTQASSLFVLGRGLSYGLSREAALKFKETGCLHAESYSAAEVLHGPAALIKDGYPILAFVQNDDTRTGFEKILKTIQGNGGTVFAAGLTNSDFSDLPTLKAHPVLQPILMAQSFYKLVNAVSIARGYNPDTPPNLSKVTETI